MADASFLDGEPGALALRAEDATDLGILSALVQDAVLTVDQLSWDARARTLALLLNRFRWEDAEFAEREGRPFERVRSLLVVQDVRRLQSDGIDRDPETVLELLTLEWQPGEDGTGRLLLNFAGDGTLAADAECINVDLRDVTRPYLAPSGKRPGHPD